MRKKSGRPQIISTSRHLSQGAVDLVYVMWDEDRKTLAGVSRVVKGDEYEIVGYVPDGLRVFGEGNDSRSTDVHSLGRNLWSLRLHPRASGEEAWSIAFTLDSPR